MIIVPAVGTRRMRLELTNSAQILHSAEPVPEKITIQDESLLRLMLLLIAEPDARGPCGRLYADSLVHPLATRALQMGSPIASPETPKSGLPRHLLRRVLERMNSEFSKDLTLDALAAESGYSRAHFLRMFRAATSG